MDKTELLKYYHDRIKELRCKSAKTDNDYKIILVYFQTFFNIYGSKHLIPFHRVKLSNETIPSESDRSLYLSMMEEFTILSFYIGMKNDGLLISDKYLMMPSESLDKKSVISNIKFYLPRLNVLMGNDYNKKKIVLKNLPKDYVNMNFSIIPHLDMYLALFRCICHRITAEGYYIMLHPLGNIVSKNFICILDNDFNITFEKEVVDKSGRIVYPGRIEGLEDGILFLNNNDVYFSCSCLDSNQEHYPQINLCKLENFDIIERIPLNSPYGKSEKNWLPFTDQNNINFYRCGYGDPFSILSFENGTIKKEKRYNLDFSRFKGSAGPLSFNLGYLFVFHESVIASGEKPLYYHRFAYTDNNFNIKKLSLPWVFEKTGIEFCRSMCYRSDSDLEKIILTVSIYDEDSWVYIFGTTKIIDLLHDIDYFEF